MEEFLWTFHTFMVSIYEDIYEYRQGILIKFNHSLWSIFIIRAKRQAFTRFGFTINLWFTTTPGFLSRL